MLRSKPSVIPLYDVHCGYPFTNPQTSRHYSQQLFLLGQIGKHSSHLIFYRLGVSLCLLKDVQELSYFSQPGRIPNVNQRNNHSGLRIPYLPISNCPLTQHKPFLIGLMVAWIGFDLPHSCRLGPYFFDGYSPHLRLLKEKHLR